MDIAYPIRVVTPTLDGPVLEVLARTMRPLTGREVHRIAGVGSPSGIRLALARLVTQGLVVMEQRAGAGFYVANRDHLAWPAVELLAELRGSLLEHLKAELQSWDPQPLHASMFGSAARGDGDVDSDVDVLLVRPDGLDEDEAPWADQVDRLRQRVLAWTGNYCQAFQVDRDRLAAYVRAADPMVDNWRRDSVDLAGSPLTSQLRSIGTGDAR